MPTADQHFRWTHAFIVALSGLFVFFLYAVFTITLAVQSTLASQSEKLNALTSEASKIALESRLIINRLNGQGFDHCNDEMLQAMQRELFLASRVKDIGFVKDNAVLCTTGQGVLQTPFKQGPWDFTGRNGFKFRPDAQLVLFDGEITAPIIQKGHFNVIFDTRWLERLASNSNRWQVVYRSSQSDTRHAYGSRGVFRNLGVKSGHVVTPTTTYSEACSNDIPYCAGLEIEHADLLAQNPSLAVFLGITGLVLGSGSSLVGWLLLKRRLSTGQRTIRGLQHNAYFPLYQPIVDLKSGKIIGCEVLARFHDAVGPLYPDEFIPTLAKAGQSWPFTQLIMQKTLDDLHSMTGLPDGFKVNINLFPSDIAQSRLTDADIPLALSASRFNIAFEITEDEHLDTATAKDCIQWIKKNGFELAVDDFGTGYSNLSKVRDLGCNTLKIDRSFVFDIDTGGLGAALVPLMVRIANELGMDVVAEGVETSAQAAVIAEMGVRLAQGWAFGKPMSAIQLEELVGTTLRPNQRT
ncbi:EAL domain-containing protein [Marinobacter sp. KMM 10035]|uniref:EAL domain-containing protein n=1 Tax=Marinobacter sp. KMM 10035 TaxID=3134034 RepID=UPI00397AFE49